MLKNEKGLVGLEALFTGTSVSNAAIGPYGILMIMILAASQLQPQHIINRANEKCVRDGGTVSVCKDAVDGMSKDQRKEYIRDTVASPAPYDANYGQNIGLKI